MFVYLIGNTKLNWYKIGVTSKTVAERVRSIQNTLPFEVILFHSVPARLGEALEEDVHTRFCRHRVRGEWFEKLDVIEVMCYITERAKQYA
jgi:hypothetical protein